MAARIILAMLVGLSLFTTCAQWSVVQSFNDAGLEAQEQARYAEAEELFLAALEEAEKFGDQDSRLAVISAPYLHPGPNQGSYLHFSVWSKVLKLKGKELVELRGLEPLTP